MDRRRFLGACGRGAILLAAAGCSKHLPTAPGEDSESPEVSPVALAVGPAWESYIKSEAYYTLCEQRTGTSHKVYQGLAMGDWDYPHSDAAALARCIALSNPYIGPLGLWNGQYRQGGWCKFFVNMVLYRSSYGYPNGHLYLKTGYEWDHSHPWNQAQVGWILQAPDEPNVHGPHTAIVVKRMPNGNLDVIDANWIGSNGANYSYAISRHEFSQSQLNFYDFRSYRAHEVCRLVSG